jgi:DNA-binding transcriptional LysR family regulator
MKLVDMSQSVLSDTTQTTSATQARGPKHQARLYDKRRFRITLKQWRMLHAVIDCDGFTAAAEYLHVSQSAISYTIAKMQEQLGIPLLRIEGRKAHLTEEGRALLQHSRDVIRSAIELETLAEKLRMGWEPELRLMVHHEFPHELPLAAIRKFTAASPTVRVTLMEGGDQELMEAIASGTVELAICVQVPPGQIADKLMSVEYVAVAHPDHKLARLPGPLGAEELARHTRIVLEASGQPRHAVHDASRRFDSAEWRFSSVDRALAALEQCLGYAWLPRARVGALLESGRLRTLPVANRHHFMRDFYLVHAAGTPGACAAGLASLLHEHAAGG